MEKVGGDGVITAEESQTTEMEPEVVEGMQFDRGFLSPCFVTDTEKWKRSHNLVPFSNVRAECARSTNLMGRHGRCPKRTSRRRGKSGVSLIALCARVAQYRLQIWLPCPLTRINAPWRQLGAPTLAI